MEVGFATVIYHSLMHLDAFGFLCALHSSTISSLLHT